MRITLDIPDELARHLGVTNEGVSRHLLEQVAVDGYRSGKLARHEVRRILGLGWQETEELLARHGCDRHYGLQDLEQDRKTLDRLLGSE